MNPPQPASPIIKFGGAFIVVCVLFAVVGNLIRAVLAPAPASAPSMAPIAPPTRAAAPPEDASITARTDPYAPTATEERAIAALRALLNRHGMETAPFAMGISLGLGETECSGRTGRRIEQWIAADPDTASAIARSHFQWIQCADSELVLPAPGTTIPPDLEWSRFRVVTPVGHRPSGEHPSVFCTSFASNGRVECRRTLEACRVEENRFREFDDESTVPCEPASSLWCFNCPGNRHCFRNRNQCDDYQEQVGQCGRCEHRYAL